MVARARLVCVDTVMVDFAMVIDALPLRGGDAHASQQLVSAGGGFNVMSAVRRQGVDALYAGQLGRGPFADRARVALEDEGIGVGVRARGELDLGVCVVLVDASGERTFVTASGAELTLRADDLADVTVDGDDVVYLSGYNVVYPEVADTVRQWVSELTPEIHVAFDPGPRVRDIDPDVLAALLERTDWLLCNAEEAGALSAEDDVATSARALRARWGCELVVVRDGARGCVAAEGESLRLAPGYSTTVKDTNGAGDVHNGVLMAEMLRSTSLDEALLRANAAAAIAIATLGPATCPTRTGVDVMMRGQPRAVVRL